MILNSSDKIPFGKYRGLHLGFIYLLYPSYIEWMVMENDNYCVEDLDFLQSLKVIDRFENHGATAHYAGIDREEFENNWSGFAEFEDVKYAGFKNFSFRRDAIQKNEQKLRYFGGEPKKIEVEPEKDRPIMIYYPGTTLSSEKLVFTPLESYDGVTGRTILTFTVDNGWRKINFLPPLRKLKVSSFFWDEWNISPEEISTIFEEKLTLEGQIIGGRLILQNRPKR
ncbi:hypothetical protein A33Q_0178 [Indibacter alkaliphilus LW1]|uniref:Uncharacterized protein n=1 Tax=Indibacter alkaliphilus (strain CCUG 57479 / KCTC 22604 / LW1) TaxID=1189612 RepID=S2DLN0_INDAL|nr:hypothetical protein [Indibacter alkaliphilus]EPA00010.1 hypothetical protein A33Q_0178 [Indibacter alkaliphilus LW1]